VEARAVVRASFEEKARGGWPGYPKFWQQLLSAPGE
jgi:hypothetical protein